MKTYTLTEIELCIIRSALTQAAVSQRADMREAITRGWVSTSGYHARNLVRTERAAYIAWQFPDHFPSE